MERNNILYMLLIRTTFILLFIGLFSFAILYYFSMKTSNEKETIETDIVVSMVSEAVNTSSTIFNKQVDSHLNSVSKYLINKLKDTPKHEINEDLLIELKTETEVDGIFLIHYDDYGKAEIFKSSLLNSGENNFYDDIYKNFYKTLSYEKEVSRYTSTSTSTSRFKNNFWVSPFSFNSKNSKFSYMYDKDLDYIISLYINSDNNYYLFNSNYSMFIDSILKNNSYIKEIAIIDASNYNQGKKSYNVIWGESTLKTQSEDYFLINSIIDKKKLESPIYDGETIIAKKIFFPLDNNLLITIVLDINKLEDENKNLLNVFLWVFLLMFGFTPITLISINKTSWKHLILEKEKLKVAEDFRQTLEVLPNFIFKFKNYDVGKYKVTYIEGSDFEKLELGTDRETVYNRNIDEIFSADIISIFYEHIHNVFNGREEEFTIVLNDYVYQVFLRPIFPFYEKCKTNKKHNCSDCKIEEIIGYATDITKLKNAQDDIKQLVYKDNLTGLENRNSFMEKVQNGLSILNENNVLGLMVLDLDNFKNINDSLGHSAGDQLLVQVANRLKEVVGNDVVVARIGGDEFTLLFNNNTSIYKIKEKAINILNEFNKPFKLTEYSEYYITTSIGIAIAPYDGNDEKTLFKHADIAMYKSKKSGKNHFNFFNIEMILENEEKLVLQTTIQNAIKNNEFYLEYQPQYRLLEKTLLGFEALIRWDHPTKGRISPGNFIPIAEETGLIVNIGYFVLEESCKRIASLENEGYNNLGISVNLSAQQFKQYDLIDNIKYLLKKYNINPELLTIEITETTYIEDIEHTIKTLETIREMGLKISIDDFGTGYSSLNYLHQFPINELKIDKSFVSELNNKGTGYEVTKTIITLAKSLGFSIVAEGVENTKQLEILKNLNCDIVQGFLLSKPLKWNEAEELIKLYY